MNDDLKAFDTASVKAHNDNLSERLRAGLAAASEPELAPFFHKEPLHFYMLEGRGHTVIPNERPTIQDFIDMERLLDD